MVSTEKEITSEIEKLESTELVEDKDDKIIQQSIDESSSITKENEYLAKESWDEIGVKDNIKKGLLEMNFIKPSKIQAVAFEIINNYPDKHLVAQSQNGSGKTAGFSVPTLNKIDEKVDEVQAIIFAHNREMTNQIAKICLSISKHTSIKVSAIKKENSAEKGHVIICTPGQFQKIFLDKKQFSLNYLKMIVLDEADYLIKTEVSKIVIQNLFQSITQMKIQPQILFFSATFEKEEYKFISSFFKGKVQSIKLQKEALTLKYVKQYYIICNNNKDQKIEEYLKANINSERVIIFVNSRNNTVNLQQRLQSKGYKVFILMGGDMDPANRDETVKRFNSGQIQILITTDLLSRGFDERLVKLVINYDLPITKDPNSPHLVPAMDTYLHRIGRTGRFGTKGIGLTLVDEKYIKNIKEIEEFYSSKIEEIKSMDDLIAEFKKLLNEY